MSTSQQPAFAIATKARVNVKLALFEPNLLLCSCFRVTSHNCLAFHNKSKCEQYTSVESLHTRSIDIPTTFCDKILETTIRTTNI